MALRCRHPHKATVLYANAGNSEVREDGFRLYATETGAKKTR
uniref:Uncharacterized protein n=1 Tax=Erwinia amylovora ATCC BAA-2158 TaxID=889211 RepID=E5B4C3_ERWAM|nr:hypothetical protein predicted by Glimmer/Critica [Erwinia amylovora ATCC BAA-2158]